jgi:hypothetical protein
VFETIRKNPKRERLRFRPRIPWVFTVGKHTRQFGYFGNPPAVVFLLDFQLSVIM